VDQAVHAVQVDERAEVDDVRDLTLDNVARLQLVENLLPLVLALFLEHRAPREHDVVARAVELDHLRAQLLAQELVEILDAADVDERCRQEAADAEVEDQTTFDDLDHTAVDRLTGLGCAFDVLPGQLEAGALLREDQAPFGVLLRKYERIDLVAERNLVGGVDRAADRELGDRDDALRLVPDVDENLVFVDAHNRPVDDLPLVDLGEGRVVIRDEFAVRAFDPNAGLAFHDVVASQAAAKYSQVGVFLRLRENEAAALVEPRALCPCNVPDVPLGIAPGEPAAPERLLRLSEQLDVLNGGKRLVDGSDFIGRSKVDGDRGPAKPICRRAEFGLVVPRRVERQTTPFEH
jgi:hypothetical protein